MLENSEMIVIQYPEEVAKKKVSTFIAPSAQYSTSTTTTALPAPVADCRTFGVALQAKENRSRQLHINALVGYMMRVRAAYSDHNNSIMTIT